MRMTTWRLLVGDVREQLRGLPDASVQVCVTSPPYWGLRDYGAAALALGRSFIGVELNPEYAESLARPRLAAVAPLFAREATA